MYEQAHDFLYPVDDGDGRYVWPDLKLDVSACDDGSRTNMGVFATRQFRCGTRFPVLGFDRTADSRQRSDYSFQLENGRVIDGDPRLDPVDGVGAHGLAIAMKINEPSARTAPNVVLMGGWMVCVRDIDNGAELFTHYGDAYARDVRMRDVATGLESTVAYSIGARTSSFQISESAHAKIQRRRPSHARLRELLQLQDAKVPLEPDELGRRYVPGRRTGIGYDFHVRDTARALVLRVTDWITAKSEPDINRRRGLFVGSGHAFRRGDDLTTYSGYIIDKSSLPPGCCTRYLATIMRSTFAIDGFRQPVSEHGMAQFANDVHGHPRASANAELRIRNRFECVLVATADIGPGEEILLSLADNRHAHLAKRPSFVVNRLRTCAEQKLCVIWYTYEDGIVEPAVCHLSNIQKTTARARWYAVVDDYESVHDLVACPFLPGWEHVPVPGIDLAKFCYAEYPPEPAHEWVPYITTDFVLRTPDLLVHAVELDLATHMLRPDLVQYLRRRL
jgi:hypothetical protein